MKSDNIWPFVSGFFYLMFLRLIHVVACFSIYVFLVAESWFIVWIYHILLNHLSVMDIGGVFTVWLLWIMLQWTFMYKFFVWTYVLQSLRLITNIFLLINFTFLIRGRVLDGLLVVKCWKNDTLLLAWYSSLNTEIT